MSTRPGRRLPLTLALFGRMSLLLLLFILSVGGVAFFAAQQQVDQIYDGQLIIGANVLRALMSEELRELPPERGEEQLEIDDSALLSRSSTRSGNAYANADPAKTTTTPAITTKVTSRLRRTGLS